MFDIRRNGYYKRWIKLISDAIHSSQASYQAMAKKAHRVLQSIERLNDCKFSEKSFHLSKQAIPSEN